MVHGDVEPADRRGVAQCAVGDHAGGAELHGSHREDVADRPGVGFPTGLDHEHLVGLESLDRPPLRVLAGEQRRSQVLAHRYVAKRVGDADHALALLDGTQPAEERRSDAAVLQLAGQRGRRHGVELGLQFVGERDRVGCWHGDIIAHTQAGGATHVPQSGTAAPASPAPSGDVGVTYRADPKPRARRR